MKEKLAIYRAGLKDGIPVCLGYIAVSFTFGIKASTLGITPWQAFLFSLLNVTSAGQFAGLDMITYGAAYMEVVFAQLIINLRYCLMSTTLSQKLARGLNPLHRFIMAFGVTDEVFALSAMYPGRLSPWYTYGLMSVALPGWGGGTLLGALFGSILPEALLSALGVAIYGMFLAIFIPVARKDRVVRLVVLAAMALSTLFAVVPLLNKVSAGFQIIIVTLLVSGVAAWLAPVKEAEEDA